MVVRLAVRSPWTLARRAALGGAALLGALLASELALRAVRPFRHDPPLYVGDRPAATHARLGVLDPALGWRLPSDAEVEDETPDYRVVYRTNAAGFRATSSAAPDGAPRVAFVGDSFTFAVGVEQGEGFAERAAALTGAACSNWGMSGYGVDQMLCALREHALRERPAVVVATFVIDDLNRSLSAYRYRVNWMAKPTFVLDGGALRSASADDRPPAPWRWLEQQTQLGELVRRAARKLGLRYGFGTRFELNLALFRAMRADSEAAGARFLLVHLPERGAWRPQPALQRACDEAGIELLDLGVESPAEPSSLYFRKDPHINAAGHAWVAARIAERLAGGAR